MCFFQPNIRGQHDDLLLLLLLLLLLCVYSRMICGHEKRALGALLFLVSSPRPPTASCSLAAERRGDVVRASWLCS